MISTLTDKSRDLTIHRVKGDIGSIDMVPLLDYLMTTATKLVIFDLREAWGVSSTAAAHTEAILFNLRLIPVKPGGKGAFVLSMTDFGAARMLESYARTESLPFELAAFQAMDAAETWLELAC